MQWVNRKDDQGWRETIVPVETSEGWNCCSCESQENVSENILVGSWLPQRPSDECPDIFFSISSALHRTGIGDTTENSIINWEDISKAIFNWEDIWKGIFNWEDILKAIFN